MKGRERKGERERDRGRDTGRERGSEGEREQGRETRMTVGSKYNSLQAVKLLSTIPSNRFLDSYPIRVRLQRIS